MEYAGAHQGAASDGFGFDGGVHSHLEHIIALLEMAHRRGGPGSTSMPFLMGVMFPRPVPWST